MAADRKAAAPAPAGSAEQTAMQNVKPHAKGHELFHKHNQEHAKVQGPCH